MEKWMIVYVLPLEVWMDIFVYPWISREEFGQLVARIGNYKFAEHAQFYLHEWGKRKLCTLHFHKNRLWKPNHDSNGDGYRISLNLPLTPLPANIKFVDNIFIYHFDAIAINFLDQIRPLLSDAKVRSSYFYRLDDLRTIWTRLTPLLGNIRALDCSDFTLPGLRQHFGDELAARLKLLKYMLYIDQGVVDEAMVRENVNAVMDWLGQPENEDNVPRMCECEARCRQQDKIAFFQQIYRAIREQFITAKNPSSFAVNLIEGYEEFGFAVEFHLENGIGEELHGEWTAANYGWQFQITRHPANCKTELMEWINANTDKVEWINANTENEKSRGWLQIYNPTIGPFDAAQIEAPPMEDEEDNMMMPCKS